MKKLSFIFLLLISILKVEGAGYSSNYYYEFSNKNHVECVHTPSQNKTNFYSSFNVHHGQFIKSSVLDKSIFIKNKYALLFYNEYLSHQFLVNRYKFIPLSHFLNLRQYHTAQSSSEDPFKLS